MATILFAWELGANLGHLVPMSRIAAELAPDGHKHVFAVRDLKHAREILGADATVFQAPVWPTHRHFGASSKLASYADILTAIGFGDPARLAAIVTAWTSLIDLIEPDVVVSDHSPGLQAALYGTNTPVIAIGSCFTMPPLHHDRFPLLQGDSAPAVPERRLLEKIQSLVTQRAGRSPPNLPSLFRTDGRAIFGHPELDPYRPYRREQIVAPPGGLPTPRPWLRDRKLFVYVGGEIENFESLIQAIAILDIPVEAFLRGETGHIPTFLRSRGVTVHDQPPPLQEVLGRATHVITQGGAMTSAAILTAGRPHLIAPQQEEARINLDMLRRLRVAGKLESSRDPSETANSLRAFLQDIDLIDNATMQATRLADLQLPDGTKHAADLIRSQLN